MELTSVRASAPDKTFAQASDLYRNALDSLSIPPNVRKDPRGMIESATNSTSAAVDLLTPMTSSDDMFVKRNAAMSITSAKAGLAALNSARLTLDVQAPQIPVTTFMDIAEKSIQYADQALWFE